MGIAVNKDIELMKVQISHEISLQSTLSKFSYILTVFLTVISVSIAFPLQGFNEIIQIIIRIIIVMFIVGFFGYTIRSIKSVSRDYEQKLQKISEMLEEIKRGNELPKLADIIEELSLKKNSKP